MKRLKIISFLLFVMLLITACGQAPAVSVTLVPADTPKPSSDVSDSPHISVTPAPADTPKPSASAAPSVLPIKTEPAKTAASPVNPGKGVKGLMPGSFELSEADWAVFNPAKVMDYLVYKGIVVHYYYIENAEMLDNVLYLTISDCRYTDNVNEEYQYLKNTFHLSDQDIIDIPSFSACVIHDGYMYGNANTWEYRRRFRSIEDWQDSQDDPVNSMSLGSVTLSQIPVAPDAIKLLDYDDLYNVTLQQFIDRMESEPDFLDNLSDFKIVYENGHITQLYEVFEP